MTGEPDCEGVLVPEWVMVRETDSVGEPEKQALPPVGVVEAE